MDAAQLVHELPTTHYTLLFLVSDNRVLLGLKKRGFGEGKYNGVGGKILPGETPEQTCVREVLEKIGVTPTLFTKLAELSFLEWYEGKYRRVDIDAFVCEEWIGDPTETDDMQPAWFPCDELPYENMWPDVNYWLPQLLAGEQIIGKFTYDKHNQITAHKVEFVEEF